MSGEPLPGDAGITEAERYHAAVAALQGRGRFGIRLGLARVRALLRSLGDPQRNLSGALVAGTNGKGSVQAIVASVLRASGSRVAQTPSPHLVSYRERIQVDGRPVAPVGFVDTVERVLAIEAGVARRHGHATEFELLVAAAFSWFREAGCDLGVIEVGMGGRLDATNAWDGGVAAVTNIDWDHMTYLGSTLEAIAREKAAIIKPGDRAVTGATGAGLAIVRSRCDELGVPLHEVAPLPVVGMNRRGLRVEVPELGEIELGLLGRHQAANAAVALAVLAELSIAGSVDVAEASIRAGARDVRWPGRLELLRLEDGEHAGPIDPAGPSPGRPDLILDGAHNVAGTRALVAAVDELRPSLSAGRITVLIGLLGDKDVPGIADALLASGSLEGARIIATRVDSPRALPAVELADALRATARRRAGIGPSIEAVEGRSDALGEAVSAARDADGPLIVAGSLYLVGAVRERLFDDPELRDPIV